MSSINLHQPQKNEAAILRDYKDRLVTCLEDADLVKLSVELLEYVVISKEVKDKFATIDPNSVSPGRRFRYLLGHVCERVEKDSKVFGKFLNALNNFSKSVKVSLLCATLWKEIGQVCEASGEGGSSEAMVCEDIELSEKDIGEVSNLLVTATNKWENIGTMLGVPQNILEELHVVELARGPKQCLVRVIKEWITGCHSQARPAILNNLKRALRSELVGEGKLALDLKQRLMITMEESDLPSATRARVSARLYGTLEVVYQSSDTTVSDGMSTLLEVQVSPNQSASYQWLKDGNELSDSFRYCGVHSELLFSNLACQGSEGKYCCRVSCGREVTSSAEVVLTVNYSPEKKHLLDVYSMFDTIPKDSWLPVSNQTYINLALIKKNQTRDHYDYTIQGDMDDIFTDKEKMEYEAAFGDYRMGMRVLVEGRPGSGKTTLVHKVTRDWSRTGLVLKGAKLVFLVSLRLLVSSKSRRDRTLSDMLGILYHDQKEAENLASDIKKTNGEGVCFLLDGYDEYQPSKEKDTVVHRLLYDKYLPCAMVVISSRPVATTELRHFSDRRIEVLGFSRDDTFRYIDAYPFEADESSLESSQLKAYLKVHKNVLHMCYLPVHAAMVCHLYGHFGDHMPRTETQIYEHFTSLTLLRKMKRVDKDAKFIPLKALNGENKKYFSKICELAFDMTVASKQAVYQSEVKVPLSSNCGSDEPSLGLVTIDCTSRLYGEEDLYTYHHLTFQEYLAAYHIASLDDENGQMKIIESHRGKPHMQVVWKFYSGIVGAEGKGKIPHFQEIQSVTTDSLFQVQCAFESQNEGFCSSVVEGGESGALSFEGHIFTPFDLTAIGYVISTSTQPVRKLAFNKCKLEEEGVQALLSEAGIKLESVVTLAFHNDNANAPNFKALNILLQKLPSLEGFDLSKTALRESSVEELSDSVHLPCLKYLTIHMPLSSYNSDEIKLLQKLHFSSCSLKEVKYFLTQLSSVKTQHDVETSLLCAFGAPAALSCTSFHMCNTHSDSFMAYLLIPSLQIKKLSLQNGSMDDSCAILLAKGLKTCLESIILDFNLISGTGAKALAAALQSCTKVEKFSASCNQIDDSGALALANALVHSSNLRELDLQGNAISKEGAVAIAEAVKDLSQLELYLCSSNFTKKDAIVHRPNLLRHMVSRGGLAAFSTALHCCHNLLELNVGTLYLGPSGATALGQWLKSSSTPSLSNNDDGSIAMVPAPCNHLQSLNFSSNNLNSEGAASLAKGLVSCTSLQTLDFSWNNISSEGAASLAEGLVSCKSLQTLYLAHNNLGSEGAASLAEGLVSCSLQTLNLSSNNFGSEGAASLAKGLVSCTSLQTLDFSRNNIGSEGAASLAEGLASCIYISLQTLDLSHNNIYSEGAASLAEGLVSYGSLQTLVLSFNYIGSEGAARLAEGLVFCKSLQTLNLSNNNICSQGAAHLAEGLASCSLRTLDLSSNNINSEGAASLAEGLVCCTSLQTLDLSCNNIDKDIQAALEDKLRICEIKFEFWC